MSDKNNNILSAAMNYALPLGLFWVFRYLFIIGGNYSPVLVYISSILSIGTPIIYYILLSRYRDITLGGTVHYGQCILFSLLLFIFASIPESLIMSLHFLIINPEIVSEQNRIILELVGKMKLIDTDSIPYLEMKSFLSSYGALYYTGVNVISNTIIGFFLSLILGYLVSKNSTSPTQNN